MNENLENIEYPVENKLEEGLRSDAESVIFDIYGKTGLGTFRDLCNEHPDWTLGETIRYFEAHPITTKTLFFRTENLRVAAEQLSAKVESHEKSKQIRILEIGCSSGEETYSLAIEMLEAGRDDFQITAVDLNPEMLDEAKMGEYQLWEPIEAVNNGFSHLRTKHFAKGYLEDSGKTWQKKTYIGPSMSELRAKGYFERDKSGKLIARDRPESWYATQELPIVRPTQKVRERVNFVLRDMIFNPIKGDFHIVIINNVLLHYPEKVRERILKNALLSLRPNGFVVLEPTMHPNKGEEEWLNPYNEWRGKLAEKFGLKGVAVKFGWSDKKFEVGQFYRYKGKGGDNRPVA